LVNYVVNKTLAGLFVDNITANYFNGNLPEGSIDFRSGDALASLTRGLIEFFGAALGCTDGTIHFYAGETLPEIHQSLGITYAAFIEFINILLGVTAGAGVSQADNNAIRALLYSTRQQIVYSPPSLCNNYSYAYNLTNSQLVTAVVNATLFSLVNNVVTAPYFNGQQPPGSPNFVQDPIAQASLLQGLVDFFGQPTVLGCTDGTIPPYTGHSLVEIHRSLGIGDVAFNSFVSQLLNVLVSFKVSNADVQLVGEALNSLRPAIADFPDRDPQFKVPSYFAAGYQAAVIVCSFFGALLLVLAAIGITVYLSTLKSDGES